jgi:uridine kinase
MLENSQKSKSKRLIALEEEEEIKKRKDSFLEEKKLVLKSPIQSFLPMSDEVDNLEKLDKLKLDVNESKSTKGGPTIIGICGAASSGKSFIAGNIKDYFKKSGIQTTILKERNFLLPINLENKEDEQRYIQEYDFDHIDAVDWKLFEKAVEQLKEGKPFNSPLFDIFNSKRIIKTKKLEPAELIIIEGRLFLNNDFLRNTCKVKIFLDTDLDILLSRIVFKEMAKKTELTRTLEKYTKFIKPSFERFIENTKKYADLIIHNFAETNFDFEQVNNSYEVLKIIHDLLKFRITSKMIKADEILPTVDAGSQSP